MENRTRQRVKTLRFDNGGEYTERTKENEVQTNPDTEDGSLAQLEDKAVKDKAE